MWPFNKNEVNTVNCERHDLLIALDEATTQEKTEEKKLIDLKEKRRDLVLDLIHFAEEKYFKRFQIEQEGKMVPISHRITYPAFHFYNGATYGFGLKSECANIFSKGGIIEYLNQEDFEDAPETYELVLLLLEIIRKADIAVEKQIKVWHEAQDYRKEALNKIEKSATEYAGAN